MIPTWFWTNIDVVRVITFVAVVTGIWVFAGGLKIHGRLRTGDARKLNHATALAGGVLWFASGNALCDRVSCHVAVVILFGLLLAVCHFREWGPFHYAFIGYARESDRPHDSFHVWFSWLVSIVGIELVDLSFGSLELTRCAALILGLADAIAEPIGSRFGKHRYQVRDVLTATTRQRSWEGSLSVALTTAAIVFVALSPALLGGVSWPLLTAVSLPLSSRLAWATVAGLLVSLVEAWTPHGLDNLTIPLSAAVLVRGMWACL